ncbi:hypothetical protein [Fodinicola acaciae]|uniref:hypothetical protein n=1 Tax=Fodinicola acaciae TaxID=2681555 RepID=UPI0013D3EA7C|nr:hypothetical protein [Fodinicola acaciae]
MTVASAELPVHRRASRSPSHDFAAYSALFWLHVANLPDNAGDPRRHRPDMKHAHCDRQPADG